MKMPKPNDEIRNLKEAEQILNFMKHNGIEIVIVEGVSYIKIININFKEDMGDDPFICCTLEHLILAIHKK